MTNYGRSWGSWEGKKPVKGSKLMAMYMYLDLFVQRDGLISLPSQELSKQMFNLMEAKEEGNLPCKMYATR
eukprot:c34745_g1_i1 orf=141-353(+)